MFVFLSILFQVLFELALGRLRPGAAGLQEHRMRRLVCCWYFRSTRGVVVSCQVATRDSKHFLHHSCPPTQFQAVPVPSLYIVCQQAVPAPSEPVERIRCVRARHPRAMFVVKLSAPIVCALDTRKCQQGPYNFRRASRCLSGHTRPPRGTSTAISRANVRSIPSGHAIGS